MRFSRSGFTMLEMLVVIAIILILAGLMGSRLTDAFRGGQEVKCRNNLRQLQVGVTNYAVDNNQALPPAMSYEVENTETKLWYERRGWVTWMTSSKKIDDLDTTWPDEKPQSSKLDDDLGYGESAKFAVEHGRLFQYVNDSFEPYVCPVIRSTIAKNWANDDSFDSKEEDEYKRNIYRTYAMSPISGNQIGERKVNDKVVTTGQNYWDPALMTEIGSSRGYKYEDTDNPNRHNYIPQAAKLLLFADVFPNKEGKIGRSSNGKAQNPSDSCISPKSKTDMTDVMAYNPVTKEYGIHSGAKKGEKTAMVVFYDGHIEKVLPIQNEENAAWYYNRGLGITVAADGDTF